MLCRQQEEKAEESWDPGLGQPLLNKQNGDKDKAAGNEDGPGGAHTRASEVALVQVLDALNHVGRHHICLLACDQRKSATVKAGVLALCRMGQVLWASSCDNDLCDGPRFAWPLDRQASGAIMIPDVCIHSIFGWRQF